MTRTSRCWCALVAALAAVVALGVLAASPGLAARGAAPFAPQIVVPNYEVGGGASGVQYSIGHIPFSTTVPRIGRAAVNGTIFECASGYSNWPPGACDVDTAWFDISFTAMNGDYVEVAGRAPTGTPAPWTVIGGSGRFAGATGSGTLRYQVDSAGHVLTLSFDGGLSLN